MKNPAASCRVSACKQAEHSVIARTLGKTKGTRQSQKDEIASPSFRPGRDDSRNPVAGYRELSSSTLLNSI